MSDNTFELVKNSNGVHLIGDRRGEYALCGDAYDANGKDDLMEPTKKRRVTCPQCLAVIRVVKEYIGNSSHWKESHERHTEEGC